MNEQMHYEELIDRYLEDEMTADERAWFTGEVQRNAVLAERVHLTQSITYELRQGLFDLRDDLEKIHTELFNNSKPKVRVMRFSKSLVRYASAAAILVGIVTSSLIVMNNYNMSANEIFTKYYEPFEGNFEVRSVVALQDSMLMLGMRSYENKDFEKAQYYFESVLQDSPERAVVNFYNGMSRFEVEKYNSAGESFHKVIEHNDNLYIEQAQWYLGFCYLMTGQKQKAKQYFNEIAQKDGFYKKKAKKVARRIK